MPTYLAIDLGAESGRGVIVTLEAGKVQMEEIHRFANRPVRIGDTLFWDFPFLFAETLATLRICADRDIGLDAIGIDTWGVDFGLLGPDDRLLSNPVHYRDSRTENIHDYSNPVMSRQDIFSATCCEPWTISSLFQLLAMQRDSSPILPVTQTFLNIPDLFNFFLTGVKASERSIVSTGSLLAPDGAWSREVIEKFSLPDIFKNLVEPGTVLGPLLPAIQQQTGLSDIPVIATCGHDTSAVAAAVPADPAAGDNWTFLSCGTWSILGRLCPEPITTPKSFDNGFCNEYTLGGWFICRNILGLWLVQELKRKWDCPEDPWDYNRMTKEAADAESVAMVDVADTCLLAPADMETALTDLLGRLGQAKPESRGQLVRCVLESLALEYAYKLNVLDDVAGKKTEAVYMVGGGIANTLLCQLTANACGLTIHAGADQCTALGNALTQAVALGHLKDPQEIRTVMRNSFEMITYKPQNQAAWNEKKQQYSRFRRS
ncbi:MAG: rhamnulokinase [Planctomycetes bacterium]|nr:rhamnulokinase [Planctomycetota bacterium]